MTKYSKLKQILCDHKHAVLIAIIPAGSHYKNHIITREIKIHQCLCCGKKLVRDIKVKDEKLDEITRDYQTYHITKKDDSSMEM